MGESFADRLGRCYELAGEYIVEHNDAVLVHGTIQGNGNPRIGHAWIIIADGLYYDPVTQYALPKDAFERFFNCIPEQTYTWEQLRLMIVKHRTWGPW